MKKTVALIIMDGYGLSDEKKGNAIALAKKPNLDSYFKKYPNIEISTSGEFVGLPDGQMGNSEVGHLNIGAGRVVYQSLTRINIAVRNKTLHEIPAIANAIKAAKTNGKKVHVMGLLSDGGVHAHVEHIKALLDASLNEGVKTYLHAFLDGRDVGPESALEYIKMVDDYKIATVSGRYYAMDRDKNYDRTLKTFNAMYHGAGEVYASAKEGIKKSYVAGQLDEFVVPFIVDKAGLVEDGDSVIFANFRPDRAIQIGTLITNASEVNVDNDVKVNFVSLTHYSDSVKGEVAFGLEEIENTLGDVISNQGMKQLRIAETEKYAHVTFFFDGGVDRKIPGSNRVLISSPKVATYDLKPEMSAYEVTDRCIEELDNGYDLVVLNFANCDMVGHTGVIEAAVKAVETVDFCLGRVIEKIESMGGVALITADHGNAEKMLDEDGKPFTAHTTNPVPLIVTSENGVLEKTGSLCDIAPTILDLLNVRKPKEMTGRSLITKVEK